MKRLSNSCLMMFSLCAIATDTHAQMDQGSYLRLVKKINMSETFDYAAVGFVGMKTQTYRAYEILEKRASRAQLIALWEHPSPIVRAYGWKAFLTRYPSDWLTHAPAHFDDSSPVKVQAGCLEENTFLGNILYEWHQKTFLLSASQEGDSERKILLTKSQRVALFKALRQLPINHSVRARRVLANLVTHWQAPPRFATDLRALANQGMSEALIPLARLKDEKVLPLFIEQLKAPPTNVLLRGIHLWPHETFLPPLLAHYRQTLKDQDEATQISFFPALASYHNETIQQIFMETIRVIDRSDHPQGHQIHHLFAVLTRSPSSLAFFEEVVLACSQRAHLMNRAMWDHLVTHNPSKAKALMSWFIRDTELTQEGEQLEILMQHINRLRPPGYIHLMNNALSKVPAHRVHYVLPHLIRHKHPETFDTLVARLNNDTNTFFRDNAAKAMKRIDRKRAKAYFANQQN